MSLLASAVPVPVAPALKVASFPVPPPAEKEKHPSLVELRRQSSEAPQIPPVLREDGSRFHPSDEAKLNETTLTKRQKKLLGRVTVKVAKPPALAHTMSLQPEKTPTQPEKRKRGRPATKKVAPTAAAFEESHALANISHAAPLVASVSPLIGNAKPPMANALPLAEASKPVMGKASTLIASAEPLVEPAKMNLEEAVATVVSKPKRGRPRKV